MSKHAEGPWETGDDYQVRTVDVNGYEIAEIRADVPEFEANARLIAAAPELLLSLKWAIQLIEKAECDVPEEIHAIIAKAEGK